jgi:hypothetical protein
MGPTFKASCIWPIVYSAAPSKPVTSIGVPCIFLLEMFVTCSVFMGIKFRDELVSTKACLTCTSLMLAVR